MTRAAVLRDPANPAGIAQFADIQAVSRLLGVEVIPVSDTDAGEIERAIAAFAHSPNGGLIATATATTSPHRDLMTAKALGIPVPTKLLAQASEVIE